MSLLPDMEILLATNGRCGQSGRTQSYYRLFTVLLPPSTPLPFSRLDGILRLKRARTTTTRSSPPDALALHPDVHRISLLV